MCFKAVMNRELHCWELTTVGRSTVQGFYLNMIFELRIIFEILVSEDFLYDNYKHIGQLLE